MLKIKKEKSYFEEVNFEILNEIIYRWQAIKGRKYLTKT